MKNIVYIFILISTSVTSQPSNLIPFVCNSNWGFCDELGKEIISPNYDTVQLFKGDFAVVGKENKFGVVNKKGKIILKTKFKEIRPYDVQNECFRVKKGNKWKTYNKLGKRINKTKFIGKVINDCVEFQPILQYSDIYVYSRNNKYGLIKYKCNDVKNDSCKVYGELLYNGFVDFGSDIIALKTSTYWQLFDYDGKMINQNKYDRIDSTQLGINNNKYVKVNRNGLIGLINLEGELIVKTKYTSIEQLPDEFYHIPKESFWRQHQLFKVTDLTGKEFYISDTGMEYKCQRE